MSVTLGTLLTICPLVFVAGFIDAIAGGGGLISLPSYLLIGLPPHFAFGTNKFSSTFGTLVSVIRFAKSGQIHIKSAAMSVIGALIGSFIGARLTLALDEKYLKYCLIVLLPLAAVFTLTKRNFGDQNRAISLSGSKLLVLSTLIGLVVGAYDGFFGPGTGTFLILLYTGLIGFNLSVSSGNAKIVNLASNISALLTFIIGGKVLFLVGVPAALFGILGNWLGSGLAIKNGSRVIRPVFIFVLCSLFIKILIDITGVYQG